MATNQHNRTSYQEMVLTELKQLGNYTRLSKTLKFCTLALGASAPPGLPLSAELPIEVRFDLRMGFGAHYTIIVTRNPQIVLAIIEAPILNPYDGPYSSLYRPLQKDPL